MAQASAPKNVLAALEPLERAKAAQRKAASQAKPGQRVGEENFSSPTDNGSKAKAYDLDGSAVVTAHTLRRRLENGDGPARTGPPRNHGPLTGGSHV